MPVKTYFSNIYSTRFDFGLPLEDIFPPNDIHPRLKYLFAKAYESCREDGRSIEVIVKQEQGTMKDRLKLKERLVLDLDFHFNTEEFCSGTHFWVIRHFLGLLPLPLLPSYTNGVQFNWKEMSEECRHFLQRYYHQRKDKQVLDYDIAQMLNMLPFENFLLLNILIVFIRRLSTKNLRGRQCFNRESMMFLTKYFCPSIFIRPFRPGHSLPRDCYLPVLLFLIIRWQRISKYCETIGHPAYFLECDIKNLGSYKSFGLRDNCTQTNILANSFFNPDVITVCRNIPYFMNSCNYYLKDVCCQTDINLCKGGSGIHDPIPEESEESVVELNKGQTRGEENDDSEKNYQLAYIEEGPSTSKIENKVVDNTLYDTAIDFSFRSGSDIAEPKNWQNVMKETMDTVKRVEESYIYDDYETFKNEEFNQIGKNRSSSFLSKISKFGFTYTPSKNSGRQSSKKASTPSKESPQSDTSYVKYPDVCENIDIDNNDVCMDSGKNQEKTFELLETVGKSEIFSKRSVSQKLFFGGSPGFVQEDSSKQQLQDTNCSN